MQGVLLQGSVHFACHSKNNIVQARSIGLPLVDITHDTVDIFPGQRPGGEGNIDKPAVIEQLQVVPQFHIARIGPGKGQSQGEVQGKQEYSQNLAQTAREM